eukprot:TRINITY_DN17437_c0_g1_i3.p1 TRINITY_DN17437_c0_g1~~TRINITY_DN17437_c0_g1_i3.p1  ORF type:complete len:351 (+),score=83.42 TRINITY_DN17437_c0_g1_i3:185-1237(+)
MLRARVKVRVRVRYASSCGLAALLAQFLWRVVLSFMPFLFLPDETFVVTPQTVAGLHTGDIMVLAARDTFSCVIKLFTDSPYSHICMIVKHPPDEVLEQYMIKERTESDVYVYETDTELYMGEDEIKARDGRVSGVQLTPIERWLDEWPDWDPGAMIGVRQLYTIRPDYLRLDELWTFMIAVAHQPYEEKKCELAGSTLGVNSSLDMASVFCSELVGAALLAAGVLKAGTNPANYVPADYLGDHNLTLQCTKVGLYGPLIRLALPATEAAHHNPRMSLFAPVEQHLEFVEGNLPPLSGLQRMPNKLESEQDTELKRVYTTVVGAESGHGCNRVISRFGAAGEESAHAALC